MAFTGYCYFMYVHITIGNYNCAYAKWELIQLIFIYLIWNVKANFTYLYVVKKQARFKITPSNEIEEVKKYILVQLTFNLKIWV